jgi:predicted dehydrogenase
MAEDKIRVGIIGANAHYGWSMRAHLPALRAMPDYELMAVCTSRPETAAESAAHYGARLAFHDYHAMVRHPDIDLVSVSVRVPLHHDMVMAALHAGKHVYCEWPLGANLAEAEAMAALARAKGVRTMIGLQANGDPVVLRLRELLTEGYVGEVLSCTMSMFLPGLLHRGRDRAWMADRAMGAHTLSIATGHAIDVLCCCVADFQEVAALSTTQVPVWETAEPGKTVDVTAPDNVLISGVLTNGAVASVHVATVPWHGTGWRLEVYGREGTLVAASEQMVQYAQIRLQGGRGEDRALQALPVPDRLTWVSEEVPQGPPFNVAQMYHRLGAAIREGREAHPDFALAVKRHYLLDAIQRSSDRGARVPVS